MIKRILPLGQEAREDLTLIFAFLGVALALLLPVTLRLIRRWTSRLTVRYEDRSKRLTLTGIGEHEIRLVVHARKTDLLYKLNVACVEWLLPGWFSRASVDAVSIGQASDNSSDVAHSLPDADGSVTLRYGPPAAKGKRPIGLGVTMQVVRPWSGWLSVRDETTSRTGRVRVSVVPR